MQPRVALRACQARRPSAAVAGLLKNGSMSHIYSAAQSHQLGSQQLHLHTAMPAVAGTLHTAVQHVLVQSACATACAHPVLLGHRPPRLAHSWHSASTACTPAVRVPRNAQQQHTTPARHHNLWPGARLAGSRSHGAASTCHILPAAPAVSPTLKTYHPGWTSSSARPKDAVNTPHGSRATPLNCCVHQPPAH